MAYTPIYTRKNFVNNSAPAINATNLNDIESAIVSLENGLQTAAADTDTNTAAITTINGEISDLNNLIDSILPDDSASGNPAVITDAFAGECKSLVLTLEPIQSGSGTPSPANPRPITGRTQSAVKRTGKNLYNVNAVPASAAGITATVADDGTLDLDGTSTGIAYFSVNVKVPKSNYVISLNNSAANNDVRLSLNDLNGNYFLDTAIDAANKTLTISDKSINLLIIYVPANKTINHYKMKIQLEAGDAATSYALYDGESITEAYGQTVYGASVDVTGGEASILKGGIDLGSLEWEEVTTAITGKKRFRAVIPNAKQADTSKPTSICSNYTLLANGGTWPATNTGYTITAFSELVLYDDNLATLSAADFKTAMSGVVLVYELINPSSISLTPQNLTLLKGDNVITTDADNVEVDYKADIALYITKQLSSNLGNRGAKSAPAEEPADDTKEEEKTDEKIIEPVTKEAKK